VRSPPGTPKRSDPAGVIYWQVRHGTMFPFFTGHLKLFPPLGTRNANVSCPSFIRILNLNVQSLLLFLTNPSGFYDPLKVDVWSLGATTWELVHADPPFSDIQDTRHIVGTQLPPVRQPDDYSRSFHDFLDLCSQPAASRPDPDELLNVRYPSRPPFFCGRRL
jgi:serine/threonine protein kinase